MLNIVGFSIVDLPERIFVIAVLTDSLENKLCCTTAVCIPVDALYEVIDVKKLPESWVKLRLKTAGLVRSSC